MLCNLYFQFIIFTVLAFTTEFHLQEQLVYPPLLKNNFLLFSYFTFPSLSSSSTLYAFIVAALQLMIYFIHISRSLGNQAQSHTSALFKVCQASPINRTQNLKIFLMVKICTHEVSL